MTGIVRALLYLRLCSFLNALRSRLRRLRQPKYLFGAIVGIAYFYMVFGRRGRGGGNAAAISAFTADQLSVTATLCAVALCFVVALLWLLPRGRAALAFSEAEIAFLFPAPISRRTLINLQLLTSVARAVISALFLSLVSSRATFLSGSLLMRSCGYLLLFSTLSLHFTGSAFVITRLLDRGVSAARRQAIALGALLCVTVSVAALVVHNVRTIPPGQLDSAAALFSYAARLADTGALHWLLLPARWLLAPLFAGNAADFALALLPALLLYAAHYVWVLRAATPFEEASLARAAQRSARLTAARAGARARAAPFAVARAPRPELAFLWKNLLGSAAYLRARTLLIAAAGLSAFCLWPGAGPAWQALRQVAGGTALACVVMLLLLGPQLARQDLRRDLSNADILKTYPLHGWQIVCGELLTPLVVLSAALWLLLLTVAMTLPPPTRTHLAPGLWSVLLAGVALLTPLLMAIQLLVANAAALLFPAWVQSGAQPRGSGAGFEVVGQRMIFLAGQMLIMLLSLVPPALSALAVFFVARLLVGSTAAAALGCTALLLVLGVEIWVGIHMLGEHFENFDLSSELKP